MLMPRVCVSVGTYSAVPPPAAKKAPSKAPAPSKAQDSSSESSSDEEEVKTAGKGLSQSSPEDVSAGLETKQPALTWRPLSLANQEVEMDLYLLSTPVTVL